MIRLTGARINSLTMIQMACLIHADSCKSKKQWKCQEKMKLSLTVTQHAAGAAVRCFWGPVLGNARCCCTFPQPPFHTLFSPFYYQPFSPSLSFYTFNLHSNTPTHPSCVFAQYLTPLHSSSCYHCIDSKSVFPVHFILTYTGSFFIYIHPHLSFIIQIS